MDEKFEVEVARALLCWYSCAEICNDLKKKVAKDSKEYAENYAVYKESLIALMEVLLEYDLPEDFPVDKFKVLAEGVADSLLGKYSDEKTAAVKTAASFVMKYVKERKEQLILQAGWSK